MAGTDTRPEWMLDPTITEVDEAAIASIGQDVADQLASSIPFVARGDLPAVEEGAPPSAASTTPSVDAAATEGQTAPVPSAGESDPVASESGTEAPSAPTSFQVTVPGSAPVELDQSQALALLQQHNWLMSRTDEVKQAWGAIEQGTHQAVDLQEFAAFQAWKQQGSPTTRLTRPIDLNEVDPDVAEYIQRLEAASGSTTLGTSSPVVSTAPVMTPAQLMLQQQEAINRQVALREALTNIEASYTKQYNLDASQVDQLKQAVAAANIIPSIATKYRTVSPTGTVISEGDPNIVMGEAFESVMATHPTFRQLRDEAIYQTRLAKDQQSTTSANSKKALAGSLAHIPSAAVTSAQGTVDPAKMTPQQRQEAMVAELAQLIASGEAIH